MAIYGNGDGVVGANQTTIFSNCLFINNTATNGGAISMTNVIATVLSSTFYNNTASYRAGAIITNGYSTPYVSEVAISNSIFEYNEAKALISSIFLSFLFYCIYKTCKLTKTKACFIMGNATITNSIFSHNVNPGLIIGVYLAPAGGDDTPYVATIKNSIFNDGLQIDYKAPGVANVSDCIISPLFHCYF